MNKNPFVPQPAHTPTQPPLPPGPPPNSQPDYSGYWAAAAAAHQQPGQGVPGYNPQWNAPQAAPRPTPEQSALYANYGYGGRQGHHWQQQQRNPPAQQHPHPYPPPPPVVQPPPPPPQQYNPYQPSAGYHQPYVPPGVPHPQHMIPPTPYQQPHQLPPPPQPYYPTQPQQVQPPQHRPNLHHTPPQHLPPAKRQRFDGPNSSQRQLGPPPPQPSFQPPPAPTQPTYNQQPAGINQIPLGMGNKGNRGGSFTQRGRGGNMGNNRGMGGSRGGRGGSTYLNGPGGGRGGGSQGSMRGQGSRGGFGKSDFHRRGGGGGGGGGGSFNTGGHQHHSGGSFRGGRSSGGRRQDGGGGGTSFGNRDGSMASIGSSGKKDENRRTLTDFKIVGLEMPALDWHWGVLPSPPSDESTVKKEEKETDISALDSNASSSTATAQSEDMDTAGEASSRQPKSEEDDHNPDNNDLNQPEPASDSKAKPAAAPSHLPVAPAAASSATDALNPPPSRIRIYFHTPVSADDSHPIAQSFVWSSDTRKGKRKKSEDDDGDLEEGRERPPPPQPHGSGMSDDGTGRGSLAPSVAETASEGDWLMAAIVEDESHADGEGERVDEEYSDLQIDSTQHTHVPDSAEETRPTEPSGEHGLGLATVENRDLPVDVAPVEPAGILAEKSESSSAKIDENASLADSIHAEVRRGLEDVLEHAPLTAGGDDVKDSGPLPSFSVDASAPCASSAEHTSPVAENVETRASTPVAPSQNVSAPEGTVADLDDSSAQVILPTKRPLQLSASLASTVLNDEEDNDETQRQSPPHEEIATQIAEDSTIPSKEDKAYGNEGENYHDFNHDQDHLPEPPASPTSNTLLSTSSGSTYGGDPPSSQPPASQVPDAAVAKTQGERAPSANRLSISYASGTRRLVVDAEVVESLKVFRSEGRIEVHFELQKDAEGLKGVLVEGYSEETKAYLPLSSLPVEPTDDMTIPSFSKATLPTKITLLAHLEVERPLSEPKWVKSGDVREWLKSMFGRMFWAAGDAADGWEKKIEVVDPDPPPTIWTVLDSWATNSSVGTQTERQRFIKTHMTEPDNILEVLLRLVRGERATPFSHQATPAIAASGVSGPLLSALTENTVHGAQQTHVSLAVLALFKMGVEFGGRSGGDKGRAEAEERMGEIVRCLPSHLVHKSLDGMFKEWRAEKKGTR